jgi:hypothetical protein
MASELIFDKVQILIILAIGAIEYPVIQRDHLFMAEETKHRDII